MAHNEHTNQIQNTPTKCLFVLESLLKAKTAVNNWIWKTHLPFFFSFVEKSALERHRKRLQHSKKKTTESHPNIRRQFSIRPTMKYSFCHKADLLSCT